MPLAVAWCALVVGCKDVSRFSTEKGESYCGKIVTASFVRRGLGADRCMRMTLDAEQVTFLPGALWTDDGMLAGAPLRPIPELSHDPLLTLNFGEGRERNFLFAVDPVDSSYGPSIMAVVSLLHSGDAEVRLIRGAGGGVATEPLPDGGGPLEYPPIFGVFSPLVRQKGTCREVPGCGWLPE
ncbi:MAG: hypothetical protein ABW133_21225 [Polyangiaceae bacterium]